MLRDERCTLREGLGNGTNQAALAIVRGSNKGQIKATVKCRDCTQWVGENCVVVGWGWGV